MSEINSNDYLELCNQLKDLNDKRDEEEKKIKIKLLELIKSIITIYGLTRLISNLINPLEVEAEVYLLIETLRSYLSNMIENELLKLTEFYISDD